jgi:4-alpha-glucanotransferase
MDRRSGILLHISSLPSNFGIGDFGPWACQFVDFLFRAGQTIWQILPLTPVNGGTGNSPYSSPSSFALNPLFISLEKLIIDGYVSLKELNYDLSFSLNRVNYDLVREFKLNVLNRIFARHYAKIENDPGFNTFCANNSFWLDDYCLYQAIKDYFQGIAWFSWPRPLRFRDEKEIKKWSQKLTREILKQKFFQFLAFDQWQSLKTYANGKNILILGDIPIYVSLDSSDVWANSEYFLLDKEKLPLFVAGAPPDYFSPQGQLWGNPIYDWEKLKKENFDWWIKRIEHNLALYDLVRLDHFRGFVSFWQVKAGEPTAQNGQWIKGPGDGLFQVIMNTFDVNCFLVEDLGHITEDVLELRDKYNLPGMNVLQFAFNSDIPKNPYLPHNHRKNSVVYTGTHDNNTIKGWYKNELNIQQRLMLSEYIGKDINELNVHNELVRLALSSTAKLSVLPIQDILGLDARARMNLPGSRSDNWEWRLLPDILNQHIEENLARLTFIFGRAPAI